jgi:hypothetical protein
MRDHLPLTRDQLQRLGHILADLAQPLVATAWADRNVIAKLNATAKGAMAKPTVRARLADLGVDIPPPDPFASRDDSCSFYSRAAQRDVPKSRRFKVRRRVCPRRAGRHSENPVISSQRIKCAVFRTLGESYVSHGQSSYVSGVFRRSGGGV